MLGLKPGVQPGRNARLYERPELYRLRRAEPPPEAYGREPTRKPQGRERRPTWPLILIFLVLAGLWSGLDDLQLLLYRETEPRAVTPRGELGAEESAAIAVFEAVSPSVVFVTTVGHSASGQLAGSGEEPDEPPAETAQGQSEVSGSATRGHRKTTTLGMGSGFVWDAAGHIVTNDHVVRDAEHIAVRFGSERQYPALVVGRAPEYELAVLRVPMGMRHYSPVPLGSSRDLRVGQTVFAIGNPFGLSRTLTQGLVSALERRLPTVNGRELGGIIQTDAAINPGNSGGPLLDSAGRLIGVNTAIVSSTGSFAGVGFAVPIDVVNRVVAALIREGDLPRPGIGIAALDETLAERLGLKGVAVAEVLPGSPAEKAGLGGIDTERGVLGDVIVSAGGHPVVSVAELAEALEAAGIGNAVELGVRRDGKMREVAVDVIDLAAGESEDS